MTQVPISFDEAYQMTRLYDTLRDMDFELTDNQMAVFDKLLDIRKYVKSEGDS